MKKIILCLCTAAGVFHTTHAQEPQLLKDVYSYENIGSITGSPYFAAIGTTV